MTARDGSRRGRGGPASAANPSPEGSEGDAPLGAPAAERAVLAAVLVDPRQLDSVLQRLRSNGADFLDERNRRVFRAICALDADGPGTAIDLVTVGAHLEQTGQLEAIGGEPYLVDITAGVPISSNAAGYAEVVREHAIRRRLLHFAAKVGEEARKRPPAAVLETAETELFAIAEGSHASPPVTIAEEVRALEQAAGEERREMGGISTGFRELDEITGGLRKSDLVLVGARPGEGKTSLALNMALSAGLAGRRVLIFSLEMPLRQIAVRLLFSEAQVDAKQLQQRGRMRDDDVHKVRAAARRVRNMKVFVDDSNVTPVELRSKSRQLGREEGGLDLIVVDYLQLMSGAEPGTRRFENRTLEIASISRALKLLARELDTPVLALSQLNRAKDQAGQFAPPQLSHLRESGALEQDADVVLLLHRPAGRRAGRPEDESADADSASGEAPGPPTRQVIVAKNRNGPTGVVELAWLDKFTLFAPIDRRDADSGPDRVDPFDSLDVDFEQDDFTSDPEPDF